MIYDDLNIIFPEIFLSVYAMVALLGVVYTSKDELAKRVTWVTAFIFILVAFLIIFSEERIYVKTGISQVRISINNYAFSRGYDGYGVGRRFNVSLYGFGTTIVSTLCNSCI